MKLLETILTYGKKRFVDKNFKDDNALDMFLHRIHPKQIVCRFDNKPFMFFEAKYQYTTARGNKKEGIKYFVFNTFNPQIDIKTEFYKWVEEFNKENPSRKLLNVKFLESRCLGYSLLQ